MSSQQDVKQNKLAHHILLGSSSFENLDAKRDVVSPSQVFTSDDESLLKKSATVCSEAPDSWQMNDSISLTYTYRVTQRRCAAHFKQYKLEILSSTQ